MTTLPTPVGHIVVLRVAGGIDLFTVAVMQTVLTAVLVERPEHVVVDLAGVRFCSGRGLAALINTAATCGVGFALSGASSQIERVWRRLWPAEQLPDRYDTACAAVLAAMADQTARRARVRASCPPVAARPEQPRPAATEPDPAHRVLAVVADSTPNLAHDSDEQLTERARSGDTEAYRALVGFHRAEMCRSALYTLGACDDPEVLADDIASRLHAALALFAHASPP